MLGHTLGHTIPDSSNTVVVRSLIAADLSFEFLSFIKCQYTSYCMSASGTVYWGSNLGLADSLIPLF